RMCGRLLWLAGRPTKAGLFTKQWLSLLRKQMFIFKVKNHRVFSRNDDTEDTRNSNQFNSEAIQPSSTALAFQREAFNSFSYSTALAFQCEAFNSSIHSFAYLSHMD